MLSLARFSIRRPTVALGGWLVVAAVLTLIGLGVPGSLSPSITVVPGTQSSRAEKLATATFGPTQLVPILLEGPRAQLDRQGPALVAVLSRRPDTRVLSAWDSGTASAGLRPSPTAAMIVASVDRSETQVVRYDQPQIERLVSRRIAAPVRSFITGQPSIDRALKDASLTNLRRTELIAVAILFVLLLIGLRAPVAALLVTAVGAISMLSGFGEVALLGHVVKLDPVGVALGTMTGLALGVGFALLVLDRFHRERRVAARSGDAAPAAISELVTTGRAVLIAGTGIVVALALVALVGPTALMISLGAGMLTCAAFATGGAVVVMPAALVLLGRRIDFLRFPAPPPLDRAWSRLVGAGNWVTRRGVIAGAVATALLAVLAVPAFALHSGPPDVTQLPASAPARIAFQEVSRVMGPGWATPYNLIIVARNRPITAPALLTGISGLESQIARDRTVASVDGPGTITATADQLKTFGPQLTHSAKISDQSKTQLLQLIDGLGQAGAGSSQLQSGLAAAAAGAGQLRGGSGTAQSGAGQLHAGLAQARAGSATLAAGLSSALSGAQALKTGAAHALTGSHELLEGIGLAQGPATQSLPALKLLSTSAAGTSSALSPAPAQAQGAATSISTALATLQSMTTGKGDPRYQAAVAALERASSAATSLVGTIGTATGRASSTKGLASTIAYEAPGLVAALNMLHGGAAQLHSGLAELRDGNAQLASGIGRLSGGGGQLSSGLGQLTAGAGALQVGLSQLTAGTGQLASGLTGGVAPAGKLTAGLGTMQAAVMKARGQIPSTKDLESLERQSPGIFSSGYFVLSAIAGAPPAQRTAATFTIDLLRGGTAGQIMVVSKYASADPRSAALGDRLARLGVTFARRDNVQLAVGGPAGNLGDLTSVTRSRIPIDVALLALTMMVVLGLATRAVLLPIIATVFGLLVAAASFGTMQLLFGGVNPVMGGPGYLDPMTIVGIFAIVFGISVTYSAVLLTRIRESYVTREGSRAAVRTGVRETAAPATGAGLVMVAALIPFATTDLLNVRAFGIGVAVAILLDTVVVRPVLLPAAASVLGRVGWWPTRPPAVSGTQPRAGGPARTSISPQPTTPIGAPR